MNWTTEAPKQDGWYWWRQDEHDSAECVEVARALGAKQSSAWMVGRPRELSITGIGGEWLGPLDPAQLLNLNNVSTTSPSYESLVKELHLTRLALDEAMGGWQPIDTAPSGEDLVLAGVMDHPTDWRIKIGHRAGKWEESSHGFKIYGASWKPLFWRRLPPNPVITIPNTEQPST